MTTQRHRVLYRPSHDSFQNQRTGGRAYRSTCYDEPGLEEEFGCGKLERMCSTPGVTREELRRDMARRVGRQRGALWSVFGDLVSA